MFLRNAWYCAGYWDMLDGGAMLSLTVLDTPVVIYRKDDGNLVALDDRCVHRRAALSQGRREGDGLRCLYHGILFDQTGRAVEIPGQDFVPTKACVKRFAAVERSGWVWIWMGDHDSADEALIPPVLGLRNPDWFMPKDFLDYRADYRLINDNLTDLSHLSYVHTASFNADETWARLPTRIKPIERGVRADRWLVDTAPIPPLGEAARHPLVDQWIRVDFMVPGIFILTGASYPQGTAERCGFGEPVGQRALFEHYSQQAVTPTGAKTSRYFFAWGPSAACASEEEAEIMQQVLAVAFGEDKIVIERQQELIDIDPDHPIMPIASDKGVVLFQKLMKKLMLEEQSKGLQKVSRPEADPVT